jgi:methyl-accepting chemotaxis protein
MRKLLAHTSDHFAREERMMRSKRYPAYAWHKGQHDTVRARLAELEKGLANGDREVVVRRVGLSDSGLMHRMAAC